MSKVRPFFVTGAAAKVILGGQTLAYCTDISYTVDVNHAIPRVLGMYEGVSLEPISYIVNGSLSVVRYVRGARKLIDSSYAPQQTKNTGNGVGALSGHRPRSGALGGLGGSLSDGSIARPYESFDPASFEAGNTFDIEVYQELFDNKKSSISSFSTSSSPSAGGFSGPEFSSVTTNSSVTTKTNIVKTKELPVVRIREARFNRLEGSVNKKTVLIERYSFTALYLDGDSFLARPSGYYGVTGDRFEKGENGGK
jgi:hypothetical protein